MDPRRTDARRDWNIPIPAEEEVLVPTVVIAPVVGFDVANYRLGNGGGYFDRTLAELISKKQRPTVVGVGYECLQIATIYPQPHDIPMDVIITEKSASKNSVSHCLTTA
jgi:5-formyltetrahydrofolate cyclo-ligase